MTTATTDTFQHHFNNLRSIAETLKQQTEPNIDTLVPMVENAIESHKFCKERIAQVELLLRDRLGE